MTRNGLQLACHQCKSCFVEYSFFQKYIAGHAFENFLKNSRENKNLSKHNCPACKRRMGLQFFGPMQIENCHPCQRLWLEQDELEKIKNYQKNKKDFNTPFSDAILGMDPNHESLASSFLILDPFTAYKFQAAEYVANKTVNKVTDSTLFKKYPVFTFCLIVALFIAYSYWTKPR